MSDPARPAVAPSSEFVSLCQSQLGWLQQALGATQGAVYLAQASGETRELVPVAVQHAPSNTPHTNSEQHSPTTGAETEGPSELPSHPELPASARALALPQRSNEGQLIAWQDESLWQGQQVVVPLVHQNTAIGLLVAQRGDREWNQREFFQIQHSAQTLALAGVLDWRQRRYQQQLDRQWQRQQRDRERLDELLHQIRNPVTALRTFGKLLAQRLQGDERNRGMADSVLREGERLQSLLQAFERHVDAMAECETDSVASEAAPALASPADVPSASSLLLEGSTLEPLSAVEVLQPLLDSIAPTAQEKHLTLETELPKDLPPIRADRGALREAIGNVLNNAVAYTPAGGTVTVRAAQAPQPGWQGITVRDSGPGIPPAEQAQIFERHYRGTQHASSTQGSGLGLPIAQSLLERMGGTIELTSPLDESGGTAFTLWLPEAE